MLICKTALLCFNNCLGSEWLGFPLLIRIRSCWTEILFPMTHPSQEAEPTPHIFPLSWPKILVFYPTSCDLRSRQKWQENSESYILPLKTLPVLYLGEEFMAFRRRTAKVLLPTAGSKKEALRNCSEQSQISLNRNCLKNCCEEAKDLPLHTWKWYLERGSSWNFPKDFSNLKMENWTLNMNIGLLTEKELSTTKIKTSKVCLHSSDGWGIENPTCANWME